MSVPTVIVNLYDIIWYDVDVSTGDIDPFFFEKNPFDLFSDWQRQGWTIYTYAGPAENEIKISLIPHKDPIQFLNHKLEPIKFFYKNRLNFVDEQELPGIIRNAGPGSFVILHRNRSFNGNLKRYSPVEIFGLVDPPNPLPGDIVGIFNTANIVNMDRITEVNFDLSLSGKINKVPYIIPTDPKQRNEIINNLKSENNRIFLIWSPIYRYSRDWLIKPIDKINNFDRPDYNYNPGVTIYVWGY